MEKETALPPTSGHVPFGGSRSGSGFHLKPERRSPPLSPPPLPPPAPPSEQALLGRRDSGSFSRDISGMPDLPPRNLGHRRAQSEILSLPDDISFDSDLGVVGSGDGPAMSDDADEDLFMMYMDIEKIGSSAETSGALVFSGEPAAAPQGENSSSSGLTDRPRFRHQHSQSMDGSTSINRSCSLPAWRKLHLQRRRRPYQRRSSRILPSIWANRQSAARSKERKMRYIAELERKVQTLQTEATTLSAQLTMLQRDTSSLTSENNELKLRLQTMEQQVHLQDALNDTLREEVQRLKLVTGQAGIVNGAQMVNFGPSSFGAGPPQPPYPNSHAMQSMLAAHQMQQLQIHPQQHQLQQQPRPSLHHPQQQQQQLVSPDVKVREPTQSQPQKEREGASDSNSTAPK
ncbi:unnamed protein product [Spirodela intermedia]|uniref:BZIP domain-containing protein n=1 Tax=Spirodela intermedia TaxID=51605 RepID=A0A7I8JDC7_SPIIN|nr:unnamed protein product [Spirodela intermedia]CAA6667735.1 unnamed protein product [Spirodela intermedia]